MKYLSVFEKVEALKAGKTLVCDKHRQYYDQKSCTFIHNGIQYIIPQELGFDWQIEEPKEPVYMTRLERIEYMMQDHFKGRVVRVDGGEWELPYAFYGFPKVTEHALLKNGQISDIRKFVK